MNSSNKYFAAVLGLFVIFLSSKFASATDIFCYLNPDCDHTSPLWAGACKNGVHQSPINIPYDISTHKSTFEIAEVQELNFNQNYLSASEFFIQDNGHTIQVSLKENLTSLAQLTGYGFDRPYILAQVHFHWGENNSIGSEHVFNGIHHPMEVHMVHYSTKYESFAAAVAADDAKSLAVLAIFLTPGAESDILEPFDTIADNLPLTFQLKPQKISKALDLSKFLPEPGETFYRYSGSLTTPNCTEDVIWTVLAEPFKIKPSKLEKFRTVRDHDNLILGENFRPIQELNGRLLEYLRIEAKNTEFNSGSSLTMNGFYFALMLLICTFYSIL